MATWNYVVGADSFSYLTEEQKQENALIIAEILRPLGWTDAAIAGVMGSMSIEGIFNPGQGEVGYGLPSSVYDTSYAGGLGLIQWTKPSGGNINPLLRYAQAKNKDWWDGNMQVEYLNHCDDPDYTYYLWGWSTSPDYAIDISFQEFKRLTSPTYCASIWFRNVERPADPSSSESLRQQYATQWYNYITTHSAYIPRLNMGNIYNSPYYTTWDAYYPTFQMPNCTAYAYGRWNELCDYQESHNRFPTGMGCDWYPQGISKGFEGGMIPQLGAAACWWYMGWDDGQYVPTGHVAIVEQINYDSNGNPVSFVTSNSAWNRDSGWNEPEDEFPWFYLNTISMSNLDDPWGSHPEGYFQGFLYNSNIAPVPPSPPVPTRKRMPFIFYLKRPL